ncbi:S8 family serine peptidase [Cytophagaceae bacterium YF14B1]|uniref:S8 family serine peptidase n=1 Tax=Xanthocytophaga flava TaxID=3048013 RepID=A0AAE3QVS4_9BACT|nr:S8 family serine peptidase [Xanthocytophaga flavus]MDJ1486330.1 S8 family serine peptidase [Xanthocytophaga flavus]
MYKNVLLQRYSVPIFVSYFLAILLVIHATSSSFAQIPGNSSHVEPGIVRIKVAESFAVQLETQSRQKQITRTSAGVLRTGIQTFDKVNAKVKAQQIKRVFPDGGKYEAKHRKHGLHLWYELKVNPNLPLQEAIAAYKGLTEIQLAEPVNLKKNIGPNPADKKPIPFNLKGTVQPLGTIGRATNDPGLSYQWHYDNFGQSGGKQGADISLAKAWAIETGKKNVIVAITDGGVDVNHPDLKASMWTNAKEIPGNKIDDDKNGYIDDVHGYSFVENKGAITPHDHGTHVAGTIAATNNNGIGVSGIAGGSGKGDGVQLMSCAVFNTDQEGNEQAGGFEYTYIYAADNGAVISQNSWGYRQPNVVDQAVLAAIDYFIDEAGTDENGMQTGPMKGGIVIFAAGNDNQSGKWYPGYYSSTLSVAATGHEDVKASYSNFGEWVDLAAPGGDDIESEGPEGYVLSTIPNGKYAWMAGTSMACPHVSGVAALVVSKFGGAGYTPEQLRARLLASVDNIDAENQWYKGQIGIGRLNAFHALQTIDDQLPPAAVTDLTVSASKNSGLTLTWTAPADSSSGSASLYELRYATFPITPDNFGEAIRVSVPPKPGPAGMKETFTLTDLTPETTYYIAIQSSDYYHHTSALSNIAIGKTAVSPVFSIEPDTLLAEVQRTDSVVRSLVVSNLGQGNLEYKIQETGDDGYSELSPFVTFSKISGTVAPGQQDTVWLTFKPVSLLPMDFTEVVTIRTNDPEKSYLSLPVIMRVLPIQTGIKVDTSEIRFGQVIKGLSTLGKLAVQNTGSGILKVFNVETSHPDFTVSLEDTLTAYDFQGRVIRIGFKPSSISKVTATLRLHTNDPAHPVITVPLSGEGIPAPGLVVSPGTISAALPTGDSTTRQITLKNTGESKLVYHIQVTDPAKTDSLGRLSPLAKTDITKVLVLSPEGTAAEFPMLLNGPSDIKTDVFPTTRLATFTVNDLLGYDVVIVMNQRSWLYQANVTPEKVGDVLADYVDAGGKVILNQFAYTGDANFTVQLAGRFMDEHYGPFISTDTYYGVYLTLGEKLIPNHPLLTGVDSLISNGDLQRVVLAPGAAGIAKWSNGDWLLAAKHNVVALNILPFATTFSGTPYDVWWGNLPRVYRNAIYWLKNSSTHLAVEPSEGTLAPGEETTLTVQVNAGKLATGSYSASVTVASNVPQQEQVLIPVKLNVEGPAFTISPDSISAALPKGEKEIRKLVLHNKGTKAYPFTVRVQNTHRVVEEKTITDTTLSTDTQLITPSVNSPGKTVSRIKRSLTAVETSKLLTQTLAKQGPVMPTPVYSTKYTTSFEGFSLGNINGQEGWGEIKDEQYGIKVPYLWKIDSYKPVSGQKHVELISDGLGSVGTLVSPRVKIGTQSKSSCSMLVNVGSGTTYDIVPLSYDSPGGVGVTFVEFRANGSVGIMTVKNNQLLFEPLSEPAPSGYFLVSVDVDRNTGIFNVYFNEKRVFTGQSTVGAIEAIGFLSYGETNGSRLLIDDVVIQDGPVETLPAFLSCQTPSGIVAPGEQVELAVEVDASRIGYGHYQSELIIDIANGADQLIVPASLRVVGGSSIAVTPTVLDAVAPYKGKDTTYFEIHNTGGESLSYTLQVLGGTVDSTAKRSGKIVPATAEELKKTTQKIARDAALSKETVAAPHQVLNLFTGKAMLRETFEGTFPPKGWSTAEKSWKTATAFGEGNYSGVGEAAMLSTDAIHTGTLQGQLLSPVISVSQSPKLLLQYQANYQNFGNQDFLDLDVRINEEQGWTNLLHWNEDHGTLRGKGELVQVALESYLQKASSFQLRWRYSTTGTDGWYTQLDNVEILADAQPWLTLETTSGTIAPGDVAAVKAYFNASTLEVGTHVAGIVVNSNAVNTPEVGIVASLEVLKPATVSVTPGFVKAEVVAGHTTSTTLKVKHTGIALDPTMSNLYLAVDSLPDSWLRPSLDMNELISGASTDLFLTLDATKLVPGIHQDTLRIYTNDPMNAVVGIPVTLTVIVPPILAIQPDSIHVTLNPGQTTTQAVTIQNEGVADLLYSVGTRQINNPDRYKNGPDQHGYIWIDSRRPGGPAFRWDDITATGTEVTLKEHDSVAVALPFEFPFYGKKQRNVVIASDGYLTFGPIGYTERNEWMPSPSIPNNLIAAHWIDLDPSAAGAKVHYKQEADRFIVQYTNVPEDFSIFSTPNTFQIILHADGSILYNYLDINTDSYQGIGIENEDGTDALQIKFDFDGYSSDTTSVLIIPTVSWMSATPAEGKVISGGSQTIDVTLSAEGLNAGSYSGVLVVTGNDQIHPVKRIPVTMDVKAMLPVVRVNPTSILVEAKAGEAATATLTVSNSGSPTGFSVNSDISWLSFEPGGGYLPSNVSQTVTLNINTLKLLPGTYTDTLYIGNGDPVNPQIPVTVTLKVLPTAEIESFALIDIPTGTVLTTFTDSLSVDVASLDLRSVGIVANTSGEVGSVRFSIDGGVKNLVNEKPYLLSRLTLPLLSHGAHLLTAQSYSQSGGRGELSSEKQAVLYLYSSAQLTELEVISTRGNKLKTLAAQDTINLADLRYESITLRANTDKPVGSVSFYLNGVYYGTDNGAPFVLTPEVSDRYAPWKITEGDYTLTLICYSLPHGAGIASDTLSLQLTVINQKPAGAQTADNAITLYPVPASDALSIQLNQPVSGKVKLSIRTAQGQVVYQQQMDAKDIATHTINLAELKLAGGVYYLQVEAEDGFVHAKPFVKL